METKLKKRGIKNEAKAAALGPEESYEYEFLAQDPEGSEFILIDPNKLILPNFDSRAADGIIDKDFQESIKNNGVLTPVNVAPVRHKITKELGYLVIAGRRRTRAARYAGLAEIKCSVVVTTLLKAKIIAGVENMRRQEVTPWDLACYFKDLRDTHHLSQTEIKSSLNTSDATVSQYLSIFDLSEPVQQLIATGKLGTNAGTKVRYLKQIEDVDDQLTMAQQAVEKNWNTVDLDNAVKRFLAKNNQKTAGTGKPGRKRKNNPTTQTEYFDVTNFNYVDVKVTYELMTQTAHEIDKLRAGDTIDEAKLQYHIGRLEAFKQCVGLKNIPKSFIDAAAEESTEETKEEEDP